VPFRTYGQATRGRVLAPLGLRSAVLVDARSEAGYTGEDTEASLRCMSSWRSSGARHDPMASRASLTYGLPGRLQCLGMASLG
jgi:hypothetical protein